jgi:hypothetical protein
VADCAEVSFVVVVVTSGVAVTKKVRSRARGRLYNDGVKWYRGKHIIGALISNLYSVQCALFFTVVLQLDREDTSLSLRMTYSSIAAPSRGLRRL